MDWSMQCWAAFPQGQEAPTSLPEACAPQSVTDPHSLSPPSLGTHCHLSMPACSAQLHSGPSLFKHLKCNPDSETLASRSVTFYTVPEQRTRVRGAQRYSRMFISSPKHPQDRYMKKKITSFPKGSKSKFLAHHNQRRNYQNQSTTFTGSSSVLATSHEPLRHPSVFP